MRWAITCLPLPTVSALAGVRFNCDSDRSLQAVVEFSRSGETLQLSGTCSGPVVIKGKNLTLAGDPTAVINGSAKKDVISVIGPAQAVLNGLTIQNGNNGINASGGAQLTIRRFKRMPQSEYCSAVPRRRHCLHPAQTGTRSTVARRYFDCSHARRQCTDLPKIEERRTGALLPLRECGLALRLHDSRLAHSSLHSTSAPVLSALDTLSPRPFDTQQKAPLFQRTPF